MENLELSVEKNMTWELRRLSCPVSYDSVGWTPISALLSVEQLDSICEEAPTIANAHRLQAAGLASSVVTHLLARLHLKPPVRTVATCRNAQKRETLNHS